MRQQGIMLCFLFIFFLNSVLYAEDSPDAAPPSEPRNGADSDEDLMLDNWVLFFEKYLDSDDEPFFDEENPSEEEPSVSEESLPEDELSVSEESYPEDEPSVSEETFPDEDDYLFYEAPDLVIEVPKFEMRCLDDIFPDFSRGQRIVAMSDEGLRNYFTKDELPSFIPNPDLEIDLLGAVMKKKPSHLIEALIVVPYYSKEFDLLDIYNALGRIEKIKDSTISFEDNEYYIFTESTRIGSSRNLKAIPDPLPSQSLPFSDTMYVRLKEINLGNLFIRGEISISAYGLTYYMTNFLDVRYFLIPIIKAERYITIIYLEPVKEGLLIYSISGFYMPGFIAERVNLSPSINNRIEILLKWIIEGLRDQENAELMHK